MYERYQKLKAISALRIKYIVKLLIHAESGFDVDFCPKCWALQYSGFYVMRNVKIKLKLDNRHHCKFLKSHLLKN